MKKRIPTLTACLALISLWLAGCSRATETGTPTPEPQLVLTAAAETAAVRLTQAALNTPSPTATSSSPTPELALTSAFETVSAQFTQAARLTPSQTPPALVTLTPTQSNLVERAEFVADVTIPDGTAFQPGAAFTKTWRLKNGGASTWTTAYALVFISGEKLGAPDRVNLPSTVQPGGTVDISVNMTAPAQNGRYRGYWKLLNAAGTFVDDAVFVEINVTQSAGAGATATTGAATATQSSPANVTNISMGVEPASFTGACPYTFTFTGRFTLNQPATVTYRLEAGTSTPGFTFNLPPEQSGSFPTGNQVLNFTLQFTQSVEGWVRLHILSPVDITSNQANFALTCQP
jgi:hypothetical protein